MSIETPTIHDFDVGPTEEEEAIATAWVEQDPAVEMESFDVREKLAVAAAYGLAAGRAVALRLAEDVNEALGLAAERDAEVTSASEALRSAYQALDAVVALERRTSAKLELDLDGEAIAHIASMLHDHDHGHETDGGVVEAVAKVLDEGSTCASVIDVLRDAGVAPPEDPDDADDALVWAGNVRARISELEEALAKAKGGERETKAAQNRLVEEVTRELRVAFKPYTLPQGQRPAELIAHVAGHLRADHKKTIEAAGAAAADAQRTIEGLRAKCDGLAAEREDLQAKVDNMTRQRDRACAARDHMDARNDQLRSLLHGATRAAGCLAESMWSAAAESGEPPF